MALARLIFVVVVYLITFYVSNTAAALKSRIDEQSIEDELFPIYECDERSRDWTVRCLVPLTNAQLSVDLCKTGEASNQHFLNRCAKDLQILGQSCPQPVAVSDMAKNMQVHKPPPMPHNSQNIPKVPKQRSNNNNKNNLEL